MCRRGHFWPRRIHYRDRCLAVRRTMPMAISAEPMNATAGQLDSIEPVSPVVRAVGDVGGQSGDDRQPEHGAGECWRVQAEPGRPEHDERACTVPSMLTGRRYAASSVCPWVTARCSIWTKLTLVIVIISLRPLWPGRGRPGSCRSGPVLGAGTGM